ncbi:glycosyltransferase family 39 protein [Dactylosporangium sp. NPDC050688]|uniref:ArnT family glycosyltransferase n=1 Tax=Dactylosporangium sp. NPDC050688 TaxID=3157217 RepID=UPI0033D79807
MTTTLSRIDAIAPPPADLPVEPPPRDPCWVRPALGVLLVGTLVAYLWDLSASGWGNAFYAAAAQAGSESWKAWFFGSSDAANFITVDKTPGALWVTGLAVRVFGPSSWSILAPQALIGVATVWLLYLTVRRWHGPAAGLLAGAVLATTPVAALMFRFNNPDALLVLLLVAGVYGMVRALERGSTWWLVFAGGSVGLGFLTKMLQALLVVPAFALAYLLFAPTGWGRRLVQLLIAGAALVASAGWWVAVVELTPASWRPYVGGSQTNSILELTLGYNGLGRITGNETGSVGGGGGAGGRWGETGWSRLFDGQTGGQASWLLPAALIFLVAGLVWSTRRAAYVLWGGWLVVTAVVFSSMQGIFHDYYTVALAPAIGALVAMGAATLWRRRGNLLALLTLAATVAVSAIWSYVLLARAADFHPWLRVAVLLAGAAGAAGLLVSQQLGRRVGPAAAVAALFALLGGPVAYSLQTVATPHSGSIVTAGPAVAGSGFGGGRGGMGGGRGGVDGTGGGPGGTGGFRNGGAAPGGAGTAPGTAGSAGTPGGAGTGGDAGTGGGGQRGAGGMGGLLNATTPSAELVALLSQDAARYTWVGAAVGSHSASGYQLATQLPVMAIGGFNGSDPAPSLERFQQYVAAGEIHYFIGGAGVGGRSNGGSSVSAEITAWVAANYTAQTVGGVTVYDLS